MTEKKTDNSTGLDKQKFSAYNCKYFLPQHPTLIFRVHIHFLSSDISSECEL